MNLQTVRKSSAAIDSRRWPAVAKVPSGPVSAASAVTADRLLRRAAAGLDPRRYNGACMVGLAGIVVKSHGRADGVAFARAIGTAAVAARHGLTGHIAQALQAQGASS